MHWKYPIRSSILFSLYHVWHNAMTRWFWIILIEHSFVSMCLISPIFSHHAITNRFWESLMHSIVTLIPPMSILKWPHACNFHKSVPVFQIKYTTIAFLACNLILNFYKIYFHVRIAVVCVHFCCTCVCKIYCCMHLLKLGDNVLITQSYYTTDYWNVEQSLIWHAVICK